VAVIHSGLGKGVQNFYICRLYSKTLIMSRNDIIFLKKEKKGGLLFLIAAI